MSASKSPPARSPGTKRTAGVLEIDKKEALKSVHELLKGTSLETLLNEKQERLHR